MDSQAALPAPRALRWAVLAVAMVAAATYALAELTVPGGSVTATAGLVACALAPALARRRPLGNGAAAGLALAAIGLALLDWWLVTGDAVMALGRAVLGLQFVRLWAPLHSRERWQVFVLSLAHLAAASVLTVDIFFAAFLAGYAVVATCALALQFLTAEAEACGAPAPRVTRRFLAGISALSVVAMLLTAAIFLIVPRVGAGILQLNTGRNRVKVAGFSDSVSIGDLGEILQGGETVMRVRFPEGGDGEWTRFRGQVFEDAARGEDGRYRWTAPARRAVDRRVGVAVTATTDRGIYRARDEQLVERLRTEEALEPAAEAVTCEVMLAPLSSPVVFLSGPPTAMAFRRPGPIPEHLLVDPDGTVIEVARAARTGTEELIYEMTAWMVPGSGLGAPVPPPGPRSAAGIATVDACTALPAGMAPALQDRLRATATEWAAGNADPADAADLIERRLKLTGGYRYTLDQPDPGDTDPIEHFLYTAKAGHCEYYAASMVLLLRSLGHPARLVTGFLGGEVNPMGGFRNVRQSDAHAWVEVLDRYGGWRTYDPTPRGEDAVGMFSFFRQFFDWVRFRWYSGVVDYDVEDQRRAIERGASRLRDWGASLRNAPRDFSRFARSWRGGLGLAFLGIGVWLLISRGRTGRRGVRARPSIAYYGELQRWLERQGVVRAPGQTPRELADAARAHGGLPMQAIDEATTLFCAVRYGRSSLDGATQDRFRAALAALDQPRG